MTYKVLTAETLAELESEVTNALGQNNSPKLVGGVNTQTLTLSSDHKTGTVLYMQAYTHS